MSANVDFHVVNITLTGTRNGDPGCHSNRTSAGLRKGGFEKELRVEVDVKVPRDLA